MVNYVLSAYILDCIDNDLRGWVACWPAKKVKSEK